MTVQVSDVVVRDAAGAERRLGDWAGKVLLIVNVASRCGFTRQYAGLEKLQEHYADQGFAVLGFPCNDFGAQEPGSLDEIRSFCSTSSSTSPERRRSSKLCCTVGSRYSYTSMASSFGSKRKARA